MAPVALVSASARCRTGGPLVEAHYYVAVPVLSRLGNGRVQIPGALRRVFALKIVPPEAKSSP